MLVVISITFVLQVLILQYAGAFFGTVPLTLLMWLKIFTVSFSVILLSEFVKLFVKKARAS